MAYSLDSLKADYTRLLARMVVTRKSEAKAAAARLYGQRARYQTVAAATGVPWTFIAVLHNRESGGDFAGVLHNGEKIIGSGRKTRLVPAGRGPFASWEDAAVDALTLKGLHLVRDWPREAVCFHAESFNGWGYRQYRHLPSPYLWAGSSNYERGKYTSDGHYDAAAVDRQLGCMVVFEYLAAIGEQAAIPLSPDVEPIPPQRKRSFKATFVDFLLALLRRG